MDNFIISNGKKIVFREKANQNFYQEILNARVHNTASMISFENVPEISNGSFKGEPGTATKFSNFFNKYNEIESEGNHLQYFHLFGKFFVDLLDKGFGYVVTERFESSIRHRNINTLTISFWDNSELTHQYLSEIEYKLNLLCLKYPMKFVLIALCERQK